MDDLSERVRRLEPRKICIIKPSSLGDVVHSLPILPALRRPVSFLPYHLGGQCGVSEPARGPSRSRSGDRLRAGRFGNLDTRRGGHVAPLRCPAGRNVRSDDRSAGASPLGTDDGGDAGQGEGGHGRCPRGGWLVLYPSGSASRLKLHAVDRVLKVAESLGVDEYEPSFVLPTRGEDDLWAREILADVPRPRLILNLGARWITKRWPPEHFAERGSSGGGGIRRRVGRGWISR